MTKVALTVQPLIFSAALTGSLAAICLILIPDSALAGTCTKENDARLRQARTEILAWEREPLKYHAAKTDLEALAPLSCDGSYRTFVSDSPLINDATKVREAYRRAAGAQVKAIVALSRSPKPSGNALEFSLGLANAEMYGFDADTSFAQILKDVGIDEAELARAERQAHAADIPSLITELSALRSALLKPSSDVSKPPIANGGKTIIAFLNAKVFMGDARPTNWNEAKFNEEMTKVSDEKIAELRALLDCRTGPNPAADFITCAQAKMPGILKSQTQDLLGVTRQRESHQRGGPSPLPRTTDSPQNPAGKRTWVD